LAIRAADIQKNRIKQQRLGAIVREETAPWWRQAEADLEVAELLLREGHSFAVAWFAQQAAENALKAAIKEQCPWTCFSAAGRCNIWRRHGGCEHG